MSIRRARVINVRSAVVSYVYGGRSNVKSPREITPGLYGWLGRHQHYSSDAIVQQIRWHSAIQTVGDVTKIDNYRAYYARMFHKEFPAHDGFFRNRVQTSKNVAAYREDVAYFDSGSDTQ